MNCLKPVDFYTKIFKDILRIKDSKHGRLLGLDVYENYVSLAVSDPNNLIAVPLRYHIHLLLYYVSSLLYSHFSISCNGRNLDTQEDNITSRVADIILSLVRKFN